MNWAKKNLFGTPGSTVATVVLALLAALYLPGLFGWFILHAVFAPDLEACSAARGTGACWGVVAEKARFILLGRYPFAEQWRPGVAPALLLAL